MPEHASLPEETELLDAIDGALDAPDDDGASQRLYQASRMLQYGHRYSAAGGKRLRVQAARRGEQHRGVHQILIEALKWQEDAEAIAFLLDMLPDEGLGWRAAVALDYLDPAVIARPLRDWLVGRDPEALPDPPYALTASGGRATSPEVPGRPNSRCALRQRATWDLLRSRSAALLGALLPLPHVFVASRAG